jgi:ABC-2 type transport system ATP-binding protein
MVPCCRLVRGVALTVGAGEVMAFLGPNGAGKTTTIDMILGLSRPDAGAVEVYGMAPRQAVRKGLVAAVMQTGGLLKDLTVAETVQYTARLFAVTRPAAEVLERAGIIAIAGRRVGKCSGGEQQRLRFAMALIPDPELLSFPGRESTGQIPGCRTTRSPCLCGELGVLSN